MCRAIAGLRFGPIRWVGALGLVIGSAGCSIGPKAIERTHFQYNSAIRRVYEEQLLQNLVRVRYEELPFRLNVQSIAAQYEISGSAEARPFFAAPNPTGGVFRTFTSVLPDVAVSGTNRPTITLIPSSGESIRKFLTPITADTIFLLATTTWPISTVMRLWVERLNGVPNAPSASGPQRDFAPDFARFQRVAALLQSAQDLELIIASSRERSTQVGGPLPAASLTATAAVDAAKNGLEYRPLPDGSWALIRKERALILEVNPAAIDHPVIVELTELLHLKRDQRRYEIVVASDMPHPPEFPDLPSDELRLSPRSTAQVYFYLANGIELPAEHLASGIVRNAVAPDGSSFDGRALTDGLFVVHTSKGHKPPPNAYVAVKYRGYWFYIDDRDQATKITFALTLELSRLDFGAQESTSGPILTLPVGR